MEKEKLLLARVSDKMKQYKKTGEIVFTSFLDPLEQSECEGILRDIPHVFSGGYGEPERKIAIIGVDTDDQISLELRFIRIFSNKSLSHRSVLGSILGLGIAREKIGDIIINDNFCDVIVMESIKDFILNNLNYVGREKVKVSEIDISEIIIPEKETKEINITVASLRLDAVLSSSLGISREKSSSLIEGEMVRVNYKDVTSVNKQIKQGDLISVRGHGRIEVSEVLGESKSGRIKIRINKL